MLRRDALASPTPDASRFCYARTARKALALLSLGWWSMLAALHPQAMADVITDSDPYLWLEDVQGERALTWVREAASVPNADFYVHTEAEFALWEMLVREKNIPDAVVVARRLAKDFPENKELIAFLKTNG